MGEAGAEAGGIRMTEEELAELKHDISSGKGCGIEHISDNLMAREKAVKDAIDRGDAEIELDCFSIGPHLGIGQVCCYHWGRMYWHRPEMHKLVKIYDPTETRTNRVDAAVVKQLNKSMDLNRNMKTAIRALQSDLNGPDSESS